MQIVNGTLSSTHILAVTLLSFERSVYVCQECHCGETLIHIPHSTRNKKNGVNIMWKTFICFYSFNIYIRCQNEKNHVSIGILEAAMYFFLF